MRSGARLSIRLASVALLLVAPPTAAQFGGVRSAQPIGEASGGFGGALDDFDFFGFATCAPGDIDGDGHVDLAVGAPGDDDGDFDAGAVWILFLAPDGTVRSWQKISTTEGGLGHTLPRNAQFGQALGALGDLDGNGVPDLAVGAPRGVAGGRVWTLFLASDGTVASAREIATPSGVASDDEFGVSLAGLGDLDGDGLPDLAVGAHLDDDGAGEAGALWILFLQADGDARAAQKISATTGGFGGALDPFDLFGAGVAALGDLDGDGVGELVVGAERDDDGGIGFLGDLGAAWIVFLESDGTVRSERKLSATAGIPGLALDPGDFFGRAVASVDDLDGDGLRELAVGAWGDDDGSVNRGAVWICFLAADGGARYARKISATAGRLASPDARIGFALAALGDLDGDGTEDLCTSDRFELLNLFLEAGFQLDFEREDDFITPLRNGQHVDTEFGRLVALHATGPNAGLALFDSTLGGPNDPSQDTDLLVGSGRLLILQTENYPPGPDDVFPRPNDDDDGGTLAFELASPGSPRALTLVDLDSGDGPTTVVLRDGLGRERRYTVPSAWTGDRLLGQPGHRALDLTTLAAQPGFGSTATALEDPGFAADDVRRLEVLLQGSGALDDLWVAFPRAPRASVQLRAGGSGNARCLRSSSLPRLGATWSVELDCAALGQGLATVAVRRGMDAGTPTPFGELLIAGPFVAQRTSVFSGAASPFAWYLPRDLALLGLEAHVQGFCLAAPGTAQGKLRRARGVLSNALDLVLGF
ncbi:MAG TPA: VCBS repeat-containing protein [Planctomycetota bacterium]